MYLRESRQKRADGSYLRHLQLVESVWNPTKRRSETKVVYNCGRADDPEVPEQARRRRFCAEYKLRILREAGVCTEPGEVGALLRREGLYSSLLSTWRRQREQGALEGLRSKKRGRKALRRDAKTQEIERLRKENERLQRRLDQAELIIDVQKKESPRFWGSP